MIQELGLTNEQVIGGIIAIGVLSGVIAYIIDRFFKNVPSDVVNTDNAPQKPDAKSGIPSATGSAPISECPNAEPVILAGVPCQSNACGACDNSIEGCNLLWDADETPMHLLPDYESMEVDEKFKLAIECLRDFRELHGRDSAGLVRNNFGGYRIVAGDEKKKFQEKWEEKNNVLC